MTRILKLHIWALNIVFVGTGVANIAVAQTIAPSASLSGATGLWRVLTSDTLAAGTGSFSVWSNRIGVNPGRLTITTTGASAVAGITDRIEAGVSLEGYQNIRVGQPSELSFGQQALGFFGNHTPGATPLPSELVSGSSRVPQLRAPATASGALTGAAGYYDLFPFAGLVASGGSIGAISLDSKIQLVAEKGAFRGIAVHTYFEVPIHKAIDFLMTHPVGTADLQFGADTIVGRSIRSAAIYANFGYRHIDQPAHATVLELADDVPLGLGWTVPVKPRLQFLGEATADVFTGSHTPDTSFGAQDPIALTLGLRALATHSFVLGGGYRWNLNQPGSDRNGFVFALSHSLGR